MRLPTRSGNKKKKNKPTFFKEQPSQKEVFEKRRKEFRDIISKKQK